jgi:hypothetical protein
MQEWFNLTQNKSALPVGDFELFIEFEISSVGSEFFLIFELMSYWFLNKGSFFPVGELC